MPRNGKNQKTLPWRCKKQLYPDLILRYCQLRLSHQISYSLDRQETGSQWVCHNPCTLRFTAASLRWKKFFQRSQTLFSSAVVGSIIQRRVDKTKTGQAEEKRNNFSLASL